MDRQDILFFVLFCTFIAFDSIAASTVRELPVFSAVYIASGVLKLPYAEIEEPFVAYYDAINNVSRIDYYNGLSKTYHHPQVANYKYGLTYKINFITTEDVLNKQVCFFVNGTKDSPVTIQSIIPNMTGFSYVEEEPHRDIPCSKWRKEVVDLEKVNRYTIWISQNGAPVHYEMMGYDTLLDSHYDKYEIDYYNYTTGNIDLAVFDAEQNMQCISSDKLTSEQIHLHNPMKELVDNHDAHIHDSFEDFKSTHGKTYASLSEHNLRKYIYRHNFRYIHSFNRGGHGYQLATNRFADLTDDDAKKFTGLRIRDERDSSIPFDRREHLRHRFPESIDWRLYGAVTPVKDQGVCGSCWSFGVTGTIEGSYFLKYGRLIKFSEQSLVDCSWGYGNNGCDGGFDIDGYRWMMKHDGLPTAESYGPYLMVDGKCHADNATKLASLVGYVNVTSGDVDALKAAIARHGPISVSIDANHKDFKFFSNGVYYNKKCKSDRNDLDHNVLAVGYGVLDGEPYWLLKNSWSSYWGNDGYILMSQRDNMCGVTTAPTYAILQ